MFELLLSSPRWQRESLLVLVLLRRLGEGKTIEERRKPVSKSEKEADLQAALLSGVYDETALQSP